MTAEVRTTQAQKILAALKLAGPAGVHSHEMRIRLLVGNPSQRIAELEADGHDISHDREISPYGTDAYGTRYRLANS